MTEMGWAAIGLCVILLVIVFISWMAALNEIRHRSRELAKIVAPQHHQPEDWWSLLESIVNLLKPLPPANTTRLQRALTDLHKLVPDKEKWL